MESKDAAEILIKMLKLHKLTSDERDAIESAVGVLAWTSLAETKVRTLGAKKKNKYRYETNIN